MKEREHIATKEDLDLIAAIAKRAASYDAATGPSTKHTVLDWIMDLMKTHEYGNKLDLQVLLDFPDKDFSHDMYGIRRHLNRETGELEDFFSPRASACYHCDRKRA